ncbi:MAG: S9 family peptidase [Gemmatimonadetes bacterium]|nr:S9 family peptidase [Gemmatimonadota bacterium]
MMSVTRRGIAHRISLCAVGLAAASTLAFAQKKPLAVEDYYRIKTVGGVDLSPDGQWVAFSVSTRVEENNGTVAELWLVPWDGSGAAQRVSAEGATVASYNWAPDGRLRFQSGGRTLAVNPTQPSRIDTLAGNGAATAQGAGGGGGRGGRGNAAPVRVVSPDGRQVVTVRDTPPPAKPTSGATAFEQRHDERFKGIQFDWLDYQRDGGAYPLPNVSDPYVSPPQELFVGTPDANDARQLTRMGLRPSGVQWNADGTRILFTADSAYRSELSYGRSEAWSLSVADGKLTRLTPDARYDYRGATYSPDGKWIVMTRQFTTDHVIAKKLNHGGATDLIVIPAAGGAERNLTEAWDYLPSAVRWSPDSKGIYFSGGVGGTVHLFRVSPTDGAVEAVTKGERRLADLGFDRAMTRMVYTVHTHDGPPEVWSARIDGTNERQLTRVHDAFMRDIQVPRTDRLKFKSADGTEIEGWITLPVGYRQGGGPYPLIVNNHGGPHSAIQYGYNFKNQYFAASGYAVLEVNFRSSTGYGEKFLWGTWGAWGMKDGQDVMAGVDLVLGTYSLDRRRVASIGHSYGGFMTNWLITQYPDRFAAAASGAGIVNWMSDYANADIARTKETEFYGKPWEPEAREIMLKQSPITYAGRAKTPTLFVVGEVDRRVPFTENEQLYVALKKQGVPAKMIVYADQPHGISGHWNNVHRMLNEKGWFDQYMKSATVP